jgi:hypothetical protein
MIGYLQRFTIRNLVSPFGLAMFSYLVFLFAWFFPPSLYAEYIHEPDLMYLDPQTLLFFTVCVVAFLFGVRFSRFVGTSVRGGTELRVSARNPLCYLLTPLLAAMLFCSMCLVLLGGKIDFVSLLAAQQGDAIKQAVEAGRLDAGRWGRSIPTLTGALWWSYFRASQLQLTRTAKTVFHLVFSLGMGIGILTCVATVDRTNLMPIILGSLVVGLFRTTRMSNVNVAKLSINGAMAAVGVIGTFLFLSFLRGALVLRILITNLLGYSVVSYNRMAALLAGVMHYAYEGRGVYLSRYLLEDIEINNLFHFADHFGWPNALGLWQTEFSSTMAAGLNPAYIWSGAFGYIYSDIGWWTPLYLCFVGIVTGYLWSEFNACKTAGLVLYPWMGVCILVWFSTNFVFSNTIIRLSEFAMALYIYDRAFLRQTGRTDEVPAASDRAGSFIEPAAGGFVEGLF